MSEFFVKGKHFVRKHVWFENANDFRIDGNYDVVIFHGNPNKLERIGKYKCQSELQRTGISDLTKSEEELFSQLSKSIRNHVNRSKRENVQFRVYCDEASINAVMDDFAAMYHEMFVEKGMKDIFLNVNNLRAYAKQDALLVTSVEIGGQITGFNAYVIDKTHARCLNGCSLFRNVDKETQNAIGRADEYLHWRDMLLCKNMGITEYDWGGLVSFENPNGIDQFKMKFGIEPREYYNITCICSFRAKVYYGIKNAWNLITCRNH